MNYQTINEERGARRAAELRRRFRKVSSASFGRARSRLQNRARKNRAGGIMTWWVLAAIVVFLGFIAL
ncbi:hypothetical protein [Roseibium salinum]|uniref:Uncharacterized protein n=1 Tax=Roseibium salinum TaxID=1604349 RepID=A0ABT3R8A0_9HYPH|nr:hypothetical protein [Roseibium sp. DSM 29163]MCX2725272.1 hypothetical protein [Roseibium sp. DSM 29163]